MSYNASFGPGLDAEIAYRLERINAAARRTRRVRRGLIRRSARGRSGSATR